MLPGMEFMIYLDNSATTRPLDEVCSAMDEMMRKEWGNPSSMHSLGLDAEKQMNACRKELASILSCDPQEMIFTSCGTESTNTVLKGFKDAYPRAGNHIITSAGEHQATLETCRYLEKNGVEVDYLPLNKGGTVDLDELVKKIRPETSLISLIHVNNETGAILDVAKLVQYRSRFFPDVKIHLDCVQSYGKLRERIGRLGIDYASISAHKIHGPKGTGLLYCRKSSKLSPLIHGGGQQQNLRSGTENLAGITGLTLASREAYRNMDENYTRVSELKQLFLEELAQKNLRFYNNSPDQGSPYILNLSFPGVKAQPLLHMLESLGVFVSTVSACSSKKQVRSYVLTAMGVPSDLAQSAIRFSFSRMNHAEEIKQAAVAVEEAVRLLIPIK